MNFLGSHLCDNLGLLVDKVNSLLGSNFGFSLTDDSDHGAESSLLGDNRLDVLFFNNLGNKRQYDLECWLSLLHYHNTIRCDSLSTFNGNSCFNFAGHNYGWQWLHKSLGGLAFAFDDCNFLFLINNFSNLACADMRGDYLSGNNMLEFSVFGLDSLDSGLEMSVFCDDSLIQFFSDHNWLDNFVAGNNEGSWLLNLLINNLDDVCEILLINN